MPYPRIMVVGGSALSSRVIERAGFGPWSHMAAILSDDTVLDARDDVVGGALPGVQLRTSHYLDKEPRWAIFEAPTHVNYPAWETALRTQISKPYDQRGIWDFAESVFTGQYVDKNYASYGSIAWFCDALQLWGAVQSGDLPAAPSWFHYFAQTPTGALNLFIGAGWRLVSSTGI